MGSRSLFSILPGPLPSPYTTNHLSLGHALTTELSSPSPDCPSLAIAHDMVKVLSEVRRVEGTCEITKEQTQNHPVSFDPDGL